MPLITQAVGQQFSGLLTPASNIVEGEIIENKNLPQITSEAKPNIRKKRNNRQSSQSSKIIRELLQFDVPSIGQFENILLVQRTDLTAEEEVIVLLHYAGEVGFSRYELGRYAQCSAPSVTKVLQKLSSPQFRQIVLLPNDLYRLTDLGSKRLREELADKLLLQ